MDFALAARVRLLGVTVRESAWSEQEEDVYAQGLLEVAGAAAGATLLGAAGCAGFADRVPRLPEEYLLAVGQGRTSYW